MKRKLLAAGAVAVAIGGIGVLHTPPARGLLMKIGGCPVGNVSAADAETVRKNAVAGVRGDGASPTHAALGFELGKATADDVKRAMKDASCEEKREGSLLRCKRGGEDFAFSFRPDHVLVDVSRTASGLSPANAADRMNERVSSLTTALGTPTAAAGEVTPDRFAHGAYATSMATYRFKDYLAEVTAMSFDGRGVSVREHYAALD